ncbi:polyribonucleotide nucleotidyltransferase, partial [Candidatus Sumerlaeota bacterium]|nr:polyribonucleotide nucleotidyltransferase [Candidatus Sumerlaeota bacterium]
MIEKITLPYGALNLEVETGRLAKQAHGAVLVTLGGTTALVAVTHSPDPLEGRDFFPLMVDYREKFYASGRMPGGFFRRESRPGDDETLKARVIDRAIRPLFPEGMRHEVMVYVTVLSSDNENTIEMASLVGASLALQISDVPFPTAVAGVRVGYKDGEYILNPTLTERKDCTVDIAIAGTKNAINMVESGAQEVSEEVILGALKVGHNAIVKIIEASEAFVRKIAKPKFDPKIPQLADDVKKQIQA